MLQWCRLSVVNDRRVSKRWCCALLDALLKLDTVFAQQGSEFIDFETVVSQIPQVELLVTVFRAVCFLELIKKCTSFTELGLKLKLDF